MEKYFTHEVAVRPLGVKENTTQNVTEKYYVKAVAACAQQPDQEVMTLDDAREDAAIAWETCGALKLQLEEARIKAAKADELQRMCDSYKQSIERMVPDFEDQLARVKERNAELLVQLEKDSVLRELQSEVRELRCRLKMETDLNSKVVLDSYLARLPPTPGQDQGFHSTPDSSRFHSMSDSAILSSSLAETSQIIVSTLSTHHKI